MPGTSPAQPKSAVEDPGDDSTGPAPTVENPGGVHPQTSSEPAAPAKHFRPPADPKTQNPDTSKDVPVGDTSQDEASHQQGAAKPPKESNRSDEGALEVFGNAMAAGKVFKGLLKQIDESLSTVGSETPNEQAKGRQEMLNTLKAWKVDVERWLQGGSVQRESKL